VAHGHDVHFLERLERLSTPETELALSLYQDPLLIRALLEQRRLPEGAARVALSLGDGARGPFVVVARDGHFVTCLAEGMSPGDHPVIAGRPRVAAGDLHARAPLTGPCRSAWADLSGRRPMVSPLALADLPADSVPVYPRWPASLSRTRIDADRGCRYGPRFLSRHGCPSPSTRSAQPASTRLHGDKD
jgi:hypothetical protein